MQGRPINLPDAASLSTLQRQVQQQTELISQSSSRPATLQQRPDSTTSAAAPQPQGGSGAVAVPAAAADEAAVKARGVGEEVVEYALGPAAAGEAVELAVGSQPQEVAPASSS
jgi:hypothetical protein